MRALGGGLRDAIALQWRAAHSLTRDTRFAQLDTSDIDRFRELLSDNSAVIHDSTALAGANRDWTGRYTGSSRLLLRPSSTQQVAAVLAHCSQRRLAVVPQGGNTGLVGGSIPVFDEVILQMQRMNKVLSFDKASGALVAQAGCVLQALDEAVGKQGWALPLDLGAKGSCHIGGNISTNAGGLRLLRYGSLHGSVLGCEVALPDGRVLDLLRVLRKDNTGYDLKQLFIGAEGTLGVVTAVAIQCVPKPASVQVMLLAVSSFEQVTKVLAVARTRLGEVLSAFEFLDAESMHMVCSHAQGVVNPLKPQPEWPASPFYVLLETHGSCEAHDREKLEGLSEVILESGDALDAVVARDSSRTAAVWRVREGVAEALSKRGAVFKYDVSLPTAVMYDLVEEMRSRLAHFGDRVVVVGYGHVGDGNLHLNVSAPQYSKELEDAIEPFVYEWVAAARGSISAEHGLGQLKASYIGHSKPPEAVALMRQLKQMFDPTGILNPYKVLPPA